MAARIDNARLALFFANKQNNHNHLQDHKRPMLNSLVQVTEEITLKPGSPAYGATLKPSTRKIPR
jgi:hypothetical protein